MHWTSFLFLPRVFQQGYKRNWQLAKAQPATFVICFQNAILTKVDYLKRHRHFVYSLTSFSFWCLVFRSKNRHMDNHMLPQTESTAGWKLSIHLGKLWHYLTLALTHGGLLQHGRGKESWIYEHTLLTGGGLLPPWAGDSISSSQLKLNILL